MPVAILSDIHGNLQALEAVLAALAHRKITEIICLGDVAASGPQPREVLARLKKLACPVVLGNTDDWLLQPQPEQHEDEIRQRSEDIELWGAQQLGEDEKAYIRTFQPTLRYPLGDGKTLLAYHGSPRSYKEQLLPTTPESQLDEIFTNAQEAVFAGGHTHTQMFRRYRDRLLLNPGSVGLAMDRVFPFEEVRNPPWTEFVIVESGDGGLRVELLRVPFDVQTFLKTLRASDMPHAEWAASEWDVD